MNLLRSRCSQPQGGQPLVVVALDVLSLHIASRDLIDAWSVPTGGGSRRRPVLSTGGDAESWMAPVAGGHRRPRRPRPRADHVQRPVPRRSSPGRGLVHVAGRCGGDAVVPAPSCRAVRRTKRRPLLRRARRAPGSCSTSRRWASLRRTATWSRSVPALAWVRSTTASSWTAVPSPPGPAPPSGSPGWRWAGAWACSVAATDSRRPDGLGPTRVGRRQRRHVRRAARPGSLLALRGAGAAGFGVVTSFVFRTVPAPPAVNFHLAWTGTGRRRRGTAGWAPSGPRARRQPQLRHRRPGSATHRERLRRPPGRRLDADDLRHRVGATQPGAGPRAFAGWGTASPSGTAFHDLGTPAEAYPWMATRSEFFRRPPRPCTVAPSRARCPPSAASCRAGPTTGSPPTRRPSSIATRCSSSSTRRPSTTRSGQGRRPCVRAAIVGDRASMGIGRGLSRLSRPGPRRARRGVLRQQPATPPHDQDPLRPRQRVPTAERTSHPTGLTTRVEDDAPAYGVIAEAPPSRLNQSKVRVR